MDLSSGAMPKMRDSVEPFEIDSLRFEPVTEKTRQ